MLKKEVFIEQLERLTNPNAQPKTYLLAVSGGVDSMVLAYLFLAANLTFEIAHINYHLRGEDSDLDQKLVEDFCMKNSIPFHLYDVSEKDKKPEHSIQKWARNVRYLFFKEIKEKQKLDYLVTAHHLNDQLETFIIHLSKAAGITGLSGIPKNDNQILRPLLRFSKQELYDFAREHNVEFREDLSNRKNDYLRNKIRNEITPKLLETNDNFLENFRKSMDILGETKDFIREIVAEKITACTTKDCLSIFDKSTFEKENKMIRFEIFRNFGFDDLTEIQKIFTAKTGSSFFSKQYELIVNRDQLIFRLKSSETQNTSFFLDMNSEIQHPIFIKVEEYSGENDCFQWIFDKNAIFFPLKLRKKEEGDFFYPLGMLGSKKVSKFYKDIKLSKIEKEEAWLLCDAKNNVLGVIPYRQDGRFVARQETTGTINIILNPNA